MNSELKYACNRDMVGEKKRKRKKGNCQGAYIYFKWAPHMTIGLCICVFPEIGNRIQEKNDIFFSVVVQN